MIIPEKIKEPRSKKFEEFKDKLENSKTLSKKAKMVLYKYADLINGLKKSFDATIANITEIFNKGLEANLVLLEGSISFKKNKKPVEFSLGKIKNMSGVKDCFMEKETLCVITEEVVHETYRGTYFQKKLRYVMPSYKIIYSVRNINDLIYEKGIEEKYQIKDKKITLGYRVQLADEEHISMFSDKEHLKNNKNYFEGIYQSPYQLSGFNIGTRKEYIGCGDVCFGGSDTQQRKHLSDLNLIAHLLGLLQTLYTEDTTGEGYGSWKRMISYEKSIKKTLKLKEKIGEFEGVYEYIVDEYRNGRCSIISNRREENYLSITLNNDVDSEMIPSNYDEIRVQKIVFENSYVEYIDLVFYYEGDALSQGNIVSSEIESIKTPKGELTIDEFNQIIKEIYESDTPVVSEG